MKRTNTPAFAFILWISLLGFTPVSADNTAREFYQLTIYYFNTPAQEQVLDHYLEKALVPALHKNKIKQVGVFKARANDTATNKLLYVLIPINSLDKLTQLSNQLEKDTVYRSAAKTFLESVYTSPPYTRMEVILSQAFSLAPVLQQPVLKGPRKDRVYELRSYESATEKIFNNKVQMFNEGGEIALFKRLQFNAIFYSEVIAGARMPNLIYMTSFENLAEREAHWKSFVDDPEWKKLSALPEYQHNVSHIDIFLLYPTAYSDL